MDKLEDGKHLVIRVEYWADEEVEPFCYTIGYFYTITDRTDFDMKNQEKYISSGRHVGFVKPKNIKIILKHIRTNLLKYKNGNFPYTIAYVGIDIAEPNDFCMRYSGPGDNVRADYILDSNDNVVLKNGDDLLGVNGKPLIYTEFNFNIDTNDESKCEEVVKLPGSPGNKDIVGTIKLCVMNIEFNYED